MRGKIFTRDEADRMLPLVRRIVVNARARQRLIQRKQDQLALLFAAGDSRAVQVRALQASCERLRADLDRYTKELEELGCFLRDAEVGIVECYADLEGRIVYLTWLPPAQRFEWYHSLETSFVKRVALPGASARRVRGAHEG